MGDPAPFRIPPGRAERAVARSVAAAVALGKIDPDAHAAAIVAASDTARLLDRSTPTQTQTATPYGISVGILAARELASQLAGLGLTPADRDGGDPLAALLGDPTELTTT